MPRDPGKKPQGKLRNEQAQGLGNLKGNLLTQVLLEGCQTNGSTVPTLWLNSTSLSPNSFLISLTSATVSGHARPFIALVDSGSSHCFVDYDFTKQNKLPMTNLDKKILL